MPISARDHDPGRVAVRLLREEADVETQQTVGTHLQKDACQQDRSGGRGFDVGVGQPGVKRDDWNLDRKGDEEAEEEPQRGGFEAGNLSGANSVLNGDKIEGAGFRVEPQNRCQHEHRADEGEEEILHGGVDFASVAVHADQERHRNQRRFPEKIEQEQI